jgi:beta-glucuronidase
MARLYRSLDDSRLITFATDRALTDICLEYCDFISVNRYPGWYNSDVSEWRSFIADLRSRMGALGIGDKPVVVSEFGAGALPGFSSPYKVKWSEELQVDILSESIEIFADLSLAGVLVWQFADIRVSAERALYRPRCFNNKGLVDENRRKKPSFESVREKFALL